MPSRVFLGVVVAASLGWAVTEARPLPGPVPPAKPADAPAEFQAKLNDDSQLVVVLLDPSVTVGTKYGKLVVPASDIRRIEPGFRYPIGTEEKINRAIDDLGAAEYKAREEAEGSLIGFGLAAVPGVRRATKSDDPEVARRAAAVLKNLSGKLGAEKMEVRDHDVVETVEFTARGRIEGTQLKVRTKHFGEAFIPLADIRAFSSVGRSGSADIALDASQYGRLNNITWMETAFDLLDGQQLDITASGQVDLNPQQPGQFIGTPGGQITVNGGIQQFRAGQFGGVGLPGQVIGRIGPNGAQFVVGASYKGRTAGSGKLYLRIVGSPWNNNESTGTYTVKVNAGGK